MSRNALGRGLQALIREPEPNPLPQTEISTPPAAAFSESQLIDIDLIEPSPFQPRRRFREEALAELAQSIQNTGIIQPLVVRPLGSRYELLAGERRWRAAQRAGLTRVPALVRRVPDEIALEITLVENIQREDLNPIEQAHAFLRLMEEFHLTQEDVAARTGKDRATVANAVRLLRLENTILELIEDGRLTAGHGRALLATPDPKLRLELAHRAARKGLNVRQLERLTSRRNRPASQPSETDQHADPNVRAALDQLQHTLGTKVRLRLPAGNRPGELAIEYYEDSQLMNLYDRLVKS
jgi:ParB family chromosome partitioning protein